MPRPPPYHYYPAYNRQHGRPYPESSQLPREISRPRSRLPPPPTEPPRPPWYSRMTISHHAFGTVLLIALAFIYVSGYYSVSSAAVKEKDEVSKTTTTADVSKVVHTDAQTTKNSIFGIADKKSGNNNKLPGAVLDEGGNFEKDEYVKEKRDLNMLPGAIGLEGAFDENKVDMFETEQDATTKSETSNEGEKKKKSRSESERIVESSGEKKKTKKKRKKKKKKKKADDSTKGEEDSKKSDGDKESGESKHKTGSKNQDDTSLDKDGLGEPKQKRKGTEGSQSSENGEFSGKDESTETADKSETQGKKKSSKSKGKRKETTNSTPPQTFVQSPGPLFTGPHPMNRKMEELQVPGNGEELNDQAVRKHYGKLVKAYLAPFADGIPREAFFEILKRRTYGMAPPGSNKGIQTLLFQLHAKKVFLLDPYDITKNSKPFYRTRIQELIWMLSDIAKGEVVPDTEFLVAIHDCVQTVNQDHGYRGSIYKESSPTFTIVSCNFSDNIPFPMWEGDPVRGGLKSWDEKMERYRAMDTTPWNKKTAKAVFRGGNRPSMFFKSKKEAHKHCDHSGRTAIAYLANNHPDIFNVGVAGTCGGKTYTMQHLSESGHHAFKYIMYAEGNCFWADRLNKQVFGPSVIIKQETPCGQFWEPLLKPMTHYIPTDFFFSDTVERITWAKENDDKALEIVKRANEFANAFLSVKGIKTYVEVLLLEYTKLLKTQTIIPEKGSKDVTV